MKKVRIKNIAWAFLPALIIGFTACGDKDDTPTPPTQNTPNTPTTIEEYILMNGVKVLIKDQTKKKITLFVEDSTLQWNSSFGFGGDSTLWVTYHKGVQRNGISKIVEDDFEFENYGEVHLALRYGVAPRPVVTIRSGEYKFEKINGIWYSSLKNGLGFYDVSGTEQTVSGIEFKIAWPSTFK